MMVGTRWEKLLTRQLAFAGGRPALLILMLVTSGCGNSNRPSGLTLLVSGDTQGWITPCGCASNQSGGLPRRAGLLATLDTPNLLIVDAGGSALGTGPYQQLKLEYLLRGMQAMGLAAHNLGASEAALSPTVLRELADKTGVQWLSANLQASDGQPVGLRSKEIEQEGVRLLITGVVDPELVATTNGAAAGWRAAEPVQSVLAAFGSTKADVKIVLAYFDEAGLRRLAESLPEVDYIIGGPTGQCMPPTQIGHTTVMSITNKGKFLGKIQIEPNRAAATSESEPPRVEIIEVKSQLQEDPTQLRNLDAYQAALAQRDFTATQSKLTAAHLSNVHASPTAADYRIAGSEKCATCHQPDNAVWHSSKHAHAWEALVLKNSHYDPHCQQCHTTGYGLEGGFVNVAASMQQVHVGCENCHGPSAAHVSDPRKKTPFQAKEQCIRCHDHENSPLFNFDQYWPRVFHQGSQPVTEATNQTHLLQ